MPRSVTRPVLARVNVSQHAVELLREDEASSSKLYFLHTRSQVILLIMINFIGLGGYCTLYPAFCKPGSISRTCWLTATDVETTLRKSGRLMSGRIRHTYPFVLTANFGC
jgi:hypothetical protein